MKTNHYLVLLILAVFFVISFLTNILGPIIPDIIESFHLNLILVSLLPFAFFIAYGFMSIPSGMFVEKYGGKTMLVAAFSLAFTGAFMLALFPSYHVAIASLFIIGSGMAMLQVTLNPLLRVAGGKEHFAFNMVLIQLVFGLASYISPLVYSYLVQNINSETGSQNIMISLLSKVVPQNLAWISIYWIFSIVSFVMLIIMTLIRLPKVELKEDERVGAWETNKSLLSNKTVIMFFIGIFAYVGTEQGVANWISKFLSTYHGYDPQIIGAKTVSWFWGLFTMGALLGLVLLKLYDSRKVLFGFTASAGVCLTMALFGSAKISLLAFPLIGFFLSSLWSIVFSLGLNSLEKHHGTFSGILCTGIIGGAVVPVIVGGLGDIFGLRFGMMFLYAPLIYIIFVGIRANPLTTNKTITLRTRKKNDL
ncbi:MFS transporter [Candidatus Latescibacterota bacterium]